MMQIVSVSDITSYNLMILSVAITIGFNQSVYTVIEQASDTTVGFPVVVVSGATSIPIFLDLNYQDGSAEGLY